MSFIALLEAALTRISEKAVGITADRLRLGEGEAISVRVASVGKPLHEHLSFIANWASEISFRDLADPKKLRDSFVDLDLNIGIHRTTALDDTTLRVSDLLDVNGNFVILGDPGAGKTTSLKRIALTAIERTGDSTFDAIPLLIRLRDIPDDGTLAGSLLAILGLVVEGLGPTNDRLSHQYRLKAATYYLEKLGALILLDGIDEIDPAVRERVIQDLRHLLLALNNARVVATCRAGDFRYNLDRCKAVTLQPLTIGQVQQFAIRWLGAEKASRFVEIVSRNPYSGSEVRPLTLAHLCAIYERSGTVPEKPKTVYRKIVRLLLEEWDEQRSIRRYSQYGNFEVDRKEEFLEALAYHLTTRFQTTTFSHAQLESAYFQIHAAFSLPRSDVERVVREVESHTGLVVQMSLEQYEFAHKSIQEYLTASYMIKLPELPVQLFLLIPHELALTVALSSSPTLYFISIVRKFSTSRRPHGGFAEPFVQRLLAERVEFTPTLELGIAVTALYNFASELLNEGREPVTASLVEFLSLSTVSQALGKYLKLCRILDKGDGLCDLEPESAELATTVSVAYGRSLFRIAKSVLEYHTERQGVRELLEVIEDTGPTVNGSELLAGVDVEIPRDRHMASGAQRRPVRLFYSYSHKDETLRNELETHLKLLQRQGIIDAWYDRNIDAGDEWKERINDELEAADVVLLLVSADFLASDYCFEVEMRRALERHELGEARVIPVIVRDVNWASAPFAKLQALPKDALAVTRWPDRDSAWRNVSEGIQKLIATLPQPRKWQGPENA